MPDYLRIGHRGAAAYALENSRLSIELALEMGVDMVEFDVRRCRDGLVLIHDSDLKRIIGRREKVKDMTVAKLKALIAEGTESRKAWKAQRQNRNRRGSERVAEEILTLEEALALIKERYSRPLIDFKETGCEEEILRTLADFGLEDGAILSSVRAEALRRVKALNPNLKTAIAYPEDRWNISQKRFMAPFVEAFVLLLK
ncbi:MAG: glycerophosphodiester phosphodiesterase, partial [Anaerolineae bacterium]